MEGVVEGLALTERRLPPPECLGGSGSEFGSRVETEIENEIKIQIQIPIQIEIETERFCF